MNPWLRRSAAVLTLALWASAAHAQNLDPEKVERFQKSYRSATGLEGLKRNWQNLKKALGLGDDPEPAKKQEEKKKQGKDDKKKQGAQLLSGEEPVPAGLACFQLDEQGRPHLPEGGELRPVDPDSGFWDGKRFVYSDREGETYFCERGELFRTVETRAEPADDEKVEFAIELFDRRKGAWDPVADPSSAGAERQPT